MDPLDLNIFSETNKTFYGMGKKQGSKKKAYGNVHNASKEIVDTAVKGATAVVTLGAASALAAGVVGSLTHK